MVQSNHKPLRVFLADDSRLIRERVAALLTAAQMVVVGEASTPAGSIDGILSVRPHVVVLDVQLDGGTGLEVLRVLRSAAPEISVIVFSNNASPAYRKRYLSYGAAGFLDKSIEFDQLAQAVANSGRAATA
ncbi:MAG: response regulator transcription factor [Ramlibacter sp.]|nr:response regulator transcription factor [Ramlibacter sp.]